MPELDVLLAFAVASLLLAVTPGPSVVLVVTQAAEGGRSTGVATALGLALGTTAWVVLVAAGLGALFAARPALVDATAVAGGVYLLWLGARRWRVATRTVASRPRDRSLTPDVRPGPVGSASAGAAGSDMSGALRVGLVVNLLNASIAVFLAAFLPPFLDVTGPPTWQQVAVLGLVLVLVSTVVNVAYALVGDAVARRLTRSAGPVASRGPAVVLAALGLVAIGSVIA